MHRFVYLKYALALVLIFIGCKIFYHGMVGKVPALLSLGVTFGLLLGGVVVSLVKTRGDKVVAVDQSLEQPANADRTVDQKEEDPQMRV
ncbi:hypothetical protein D3C79_661220 [compost metagenome]